MTHCTANSTAHAVSHKLQISFLKNCSKSMFYNQISVSQEHTDILAGNSGYSLHSSGPGEEQTVIATKQGKDKFSIAPFLCNSSISAVLNANLLHNLYLFLPHLLGACSFDVCSLCVNVFLTVCRCDYNYNYN